jgi:poly(3-hydroxybutyrate) depolymerase
MLEPHSRSSPRLVLALTLSLALGACGSEPGGGAGNAAGGSANNDDGNANASGRRDTGRAGTQSGGALGDGAIGADASGGSSNDAADGGRNAPDASDGSAVALDAAPRDAPADAVSSSSDGGRRSAGCGLAATGTSSYVRQTITVRNATREYYLWVPRTYAPDQAYPVIFRWHGSTGNGLSGGLEIEASSRESAIIASPSGIGGNWDNSPSGVDVQLFDMLLARLESAYCIDTARVFSYGFSAGGGFTNLLACVRSTVVRAVAPVESFAPVATCPGRVAAWITHSADDQVEPIALGVRVRSLFLAANGCGMTTMPVTPSPCVRYQGCAAGYPVDWCQTSGPHDPQGSFTGPGAWSFFDAIR